MREDKLDAITQEHGPTADSGMAVPVRNEQALERLRRNDCEGYNVRHQHTAVFQEVFVSLGFEAFDNRGHKLSLERTVVDGTADRVVLLTVSRRVSASDRAGRPTS